MIRGGSRDRACPIRLLASVRCKKVSNKRPVAFTGKAGGLVHRERKTTESETRIHFKYPQAKPGALHKYRRLRTPFEKVRESYCRCGGGGGGGGWGGGVKAYRITNQMRGIGSRQLT